MEIDWKNKVVFLNISVVPLGAAISELLMEQGVKHVTILDTDEKAGISLQNELNTKYSGDRVHFINGDVLINNQLERSFQDVIAVQGYIDVVLNNASLINEGSEFYAKMININFTSLVTSTLKSFENMSMENGGKGGTVINLTSIIALTPCYPLPIYTATRAAILKFSHLVGKPEYLSRTGVRVFTVVIGAYDTPLIHPDNFQCFDKKLVADFIGATSKIPVQKVETIAQGIADAYNQATGGSTWVITSSRLENITATIDKSFELANILHMFQ